VLDYLDDIASDLSVFHRIADAGEMEAPVFFMLARRLPAYQGVLAARLAAEGNGKRGGGNGRAPAASYERGSGRENRAATAAAAPALTAGMIAGLNMQLGGQWFRHTVLPPAGGGQ
jgi:hypothetical protein